MKLSGIHHAFLFFATDTDMLYRWYSASHGKGVIARKEIQKAGTANVGIIME